MRVFLPLGLSLVLLLSAAEAAPDRGWTYEVAFDADFETAEVTMRFQHFLPRNLVLGEPSALGAIEVLPRPNGSPSFRANSARDGIVPVGLQQDRVLRWRVDLDAAARAGGGGRVGDDLVLPPGAFLFAPGYWPDDARVEASFDLPRDRAAVVPWTPLRTTSADAQGIVRRTWSLRRGATTRWNEIALGRFEPLDIEVEGGTLHVAILDRPHRASREGIAHWLSEAARASTTLWGRFPLNHAAILVEAGGGGRDAVGFGRTWVVGGGTVHLYLSAGATDERLPGEWVAVHEIVHLGLPSVADEARWFGEGLATYYQEVMRARSGLRTPAQAWYNLRDGFRRGASRGGDRPLREQCRLMHQTHQYWRVYWAGAALALKLDMALRKQSEGRLSLDDAMRAMHRERVRLAPKMWRSGELLAEIDRALGVDLAVDLVTPWLDSTEFPDLTAEMGPENAALRAAIMEK